VDGLEHEVDDGAVRQAGRREGVADGLHLAHDVCCGLWVARVEARLLKGVVLGLCGVDGGTCCPAVPRLRKRVENSSQVMVEKSRSSPALRMGRMEGWMRDTAYMAQSFLLAC
jgi:hypothetical protein